MELFKGRPMAAAGAAVLAAALIGYYFRAEVKIALAVLCAAALAVFLVLVIRRSSRRYRHFTRCVLLALTLGMLVRSLFYWDVRYAAAKELSGEGRTVCGYVTHTNASGGFYSSYEVRLTGADGKKTSQKAVLRCDFASDLQNGYAFSVENAVISPVADNGAGYAGREQAEGILLEISCAEPESLTIVTENDFHFLRLTEAVRSGLSGRFVSFLGKERGGLAAAMLLRDRDVLPDYLTRDFSRAGISHLLAVSGLHFSLVTGVLVRFLQRLKLPKTGVLVCSLTFAFAYLALLGFPMSALRSFIMLAAAFGGQLFGFDTDGVNSLGIALCVILPVFPGAFLDAGFVMSFCAVLGITAMLPTPEERREKEERQKAGEGGRSARPVAAWFRAALSALGTAVLTVICAQLLTVLPLMKIGGELSLAAVPVNLIACPLAALFLTLLLLFIPLSFVPGVSGWLAFVIGKLAEVFIRLTGWVSEIRGVSVSLGYDFLPYLLIPGTVLTVLFLVVRLKRKWLCFTPAAVCAVLFCVLLTVSAGKNEVRADFLSVDGNDYAVLTGKGSTVLIDASDGSSTGLKTAVRFAEEQGSAELEVIVLTHYHIAHEASVAELLRSERVRRLWMPRPVTETDAEVMMKLCAVAAGKECGCACVIYDPGTETDTFGGLRLTLSGPSYLTRSTHPVFSFSMTEGTGVVTYLSSSAWESEAAVVNPEPCSLLLLGAHGPVVREAPSVLPYAVDTTVLGAPAVPLIAPGSPLAVFRDTVRLSEGAERKTFVFRQFVSAK